MKIYITLIFIFLILTGCYSTKRTSDNTTTNQPDGIVRIANDSLEYEILIIDIGFESYLNSIAKPINYYSQSYYELKNKFYVPIWNQRVTNSYYNKRSIYENIIDYNYNIDYGLDVNYKLFNYFKFVEYKYKEKF